MRQVLTATHQLANDLDLADSLIWDYGRSWAPTGTSGTGNQFTGSFDGGGNTIRNLHINRPATLYQGLFGYVTTHLALRNIRLRDVNVHGGSYSGGLVGYGANTIIEPVPRFCR